MKLTASIRFQQPIVVKNGDNEPLPKIEFYSGELVVNDGIVRLWGTDGVYLDSNNLEVSRFNGRVRLPLSEVEGL